jgi:hypothetical protein
MLHGTTVKKKYKILITFKNSSSFLFCNSYKQLNSTWIRES